MTSASHAEGRQFDPGQVYARHAREAPNPCGHARCGGMPHLLRKSINSINRRAHMTCTHPRRLKIQARPKPICHHRAHINTPRTRPPAINNLHHKAYRRSGPQLRSKTHVDATARVQRAWEVWSARRCQYGPRAEHACRTLRSRWDCSCSTSGPRHNDTCGIRTHAGRPHRLSRPTP